jgi:hypothetical protein
MTGSQIIKRYNRAHAIVQKVYDRIYSDTGSDLLNDQIHDNMLYQLQGMYADCLDILDDYDNGQAITDKDFEAIEQAVSYAKTVGKALTACMKVSSSPYC